MNAIAGTTGPGARRDFFYLDDDFQMRQRSWNGSEWSHDWIQLGGIFTTAPCVVASTGRRPVSVSPGTLARQLPDLGGRDVLIDRGEVLHDRLDVFGLGLDYAMWHKTLWGSAAASPGAWQSLGGVFTSAPAAIWHDGALHVFGLGQDQSMFWRTYDGTSWSPEWKRIGGYFSSVPVVVASRPDRLHLFARGADFSLRHQAFAQGSWNDDWQNLGDSLASAPAVTSWGPDRVDVFAIAGSDGSLAHRWWDGEIWNEWERLVGKAVGDDVAFTSAPAVVSTRQERIDVLAVDSTGVLQHVWLDDDAWTGPVPLSPHWRMASTPLALTIGPAELDVIAPGRDHNLYRKTLQGSEWTPGGWSQLGDKLRETSQYRVSIDSIRVNTPRSLNNDTVSGQCTLKIGNWPTAIGLDSWPLRPLSQHQGDMGNTAVDTGQTNLMHYEPVTIELHETVAFHYTFVNSHKPEAEVEEALEKLGASLVEAAVKAAVKAASSGVGLTTVEVAGLATPLMGPALGLLAGFLATQLVTLLKDEGCDGVVALEQYVRRGDELQQMTRHGQTVSMDVVHEGTDDTAGHCGAESEYVVTWSISPAAS